MIPTNPRHRHTPCLGAFLLLVSLTGLTFTAQAKSPLQECFDKAVPQVELNKCTIIPLTEDASLGIIVGRGRTHESLLSRQSLSY